MWIFVRSANTAFNMSHITRLFVEETGSGAALKAELQGKTTMIGYFGSKPEAQAKLEDIMERHEAGAPVIRL